MDIDGTNEEVLMGRFIFNKNKTEEVKNKSEFTGSDAMIKFNQLYKDVIKLDTSRSYPVKLYDYLQMLCGEVGVSLGSSSIVNGDYQVLGNAFTNNEDCKTVLSHIAQISGGIAKIGRDNKLYIINLDNSSIPNSYTRVDYIESTGTQFIDTGVLGSYTNSINFDMKLSITSNETSRETAILGSKKEDNSGTTMFLPSDSYNLRTWSGSGTAWAVTDIEAATDYIINITYNVPSGRIVYINNDKYESTTVSNNANNSDKNFGIFGDRAYQASNLTSMKLYYLKITKDDELIRDFIPCKRNSDNKLGLYDTIVSVVKHIKCKPESKSKSTILKHLFFNISINIGIY